MQFHLNGFYPGDPRFYDPRDRVVPPPIKRPLPEEVDVFIVGLRRSRAGDGATDV